MREEGRKRGKRSVYRDTFASQNHITKKNAIYVNIEQLEPSNSLDYSCTYIAFRALKINQLCCQD